MEIRPNPPSRMLRALRWAVASGTLKRGYGRLLKYLPVPVWGGRDILMPTAVGPMVMSVKDQANAGLLLWGRIRHETNETALIRALACSFQITLDVGAHIGWYSRLMGQAMNGTGTVYAFEPNPASFPYLIENIRDYASVHPFQIAIADSDETVTFYCADSSNLSSAARQVGTPVVVDCKSLDSFARSFGLIGKIDFIKCDVEGGEVSVLHGSHLVRSAASPPIWMIEVDNVFLTEAGVSVDKLNLEILACGGALHLFYLDVDGAAREITRLGEQGGIPNIFVVPESRMMTFRSAILSAGLKLPG